MTDIEDINFALVEKTRPPLYTAMKYWGKKPHNIWREYIERYTPKNGIFLDPFAGSAISIFEALKSNRKAIGFDLNPLTSFIIEVLSSNYDEAIFKQKAHEILNKVKNSEIYKEFYSTKCPICGNISATVQNAKWDSGNIYEIGVECENCTLLKSNTKTSVVKHWCGQAKRYLKKPDDIDIEKIKKTDNIQFNYWIPDKEFPESPSFSGNLISHLGGNKFRDLWTKRNLNILSQIFHLIKEVSDSELQSQLLFGFIQTLHLCTKMCVPRRSSANRPFATSWGRSAYLCSNRQMEMNPLLVFESSCFGKQSVSSALSSAIEYLGNKPKLLYTDESNKSNRSTNFDIKYGAVDIAVLTSYIDDKSIDFIMTDPPYGGLVQYLDLSSLWLVWMEGINPRYVPHYEAEITIKKGIQNEDAYGRKFLNGLKQLNKVLKDEGKIVFTFHNKDIKIWNQFLKSISLSGFKIEKVIHQQNRRTGESNVANPYGTSASDFYIRCIKQSSYGQEKSENELNHFIITKAIEIISLRNEPTPYQILFNGLLAEISKAGFNIENFDSTLESILSKEIGNVFIITKNNQTKAGNYWWLSNPDDYIKYRDKNLSERLEETITMLLRRKVSVILDEVLAEIFVKYPNGLTPDIKSVTNILSKYAYKSGGKWVYKGDVFEKEFTKHTEILYLLNIIGKKLGFKTFIGRREQPEMYKGEKLKKYADYGDLSQLNFSDSEQIKRLEMIDMLWIKNGVIIYAIEVENSTNFTSGIQRGSNLPNEVKKIMIIPDNRKTEFSRIRDPLFMESFKKYNWKFMYYTDVKNLEKQRILSESSLILYLVNL